MGNCDNICTGQQQSDDKTFEVKIRKQQHIQILNHSRKAQPVLNIKCQLCDIQISDITEQRTFKEFQKHFQFCHFGKIQKKNQDYIITCILCGFQSLSLVGFQNHLSFRHKYLEQQISKNIQMYKNQDQIISYQQIKNNLKQVNHKDFSLLRSKVDAKNLYLAKLKQKKTNAIVNQKQYTSMQFHRDKALGDLVYRYIFTQYPQVQSYSIFVEAQKKKIVCRSTIFLPSDQ